MEAVRIRKRLVKPVDEMGMEFVADQPLLVVGRPVIFTNARFKVKERTLDKDGTLHVTLKADRSSRKSRRSAR